MEVKQRFADLGRLGRGAGPRQHAKEPVQPESDPEDEDPAEDLDEDGKEKGTPMAVNKDSDDFKAGLKAGEEAGQKAALERVNIVVASEHYAGREKLASTLLKSSMSAEDIVGALADAPKAAPAASEQPAKPNAKDGEGEDEKDRAAMRERLATADKPDLGDGDQADVNAEAKAKAENYGWDKIHAEVEARRTATV